MAFVPYTDGAKLCIDFTLNGVGVSICLNFTKPTPTPADYQLLADTLASNIGSHIMTELVADLTANQVTVYDMSSAIAPVYTSVSGLPVSGAIAQDATPNNSAMVVTHRTDNRGRSFRGRSYIPGNPETDVVDGLFNSGAVLGVVTDFEDMITLTEITSGWTHVVASTYSNGVPRSTAVLTPVTSYTANREVNSQRRRTVRD